MATPARSPTERRVSSACWCIVERAAKIALAAAQHAEAIEIGTDAGLIADGPADSERFLIARAGARHIAALGEHSGSFIERPCDTLAVSGREVQLLRLRGLRKRALRIARFERDAAGDEVRAGGQDSHTLRRARLGGAQGGIASGVEVRAAASMASASARSTRGSRAADGRARSERSV